MTEATDMRSEREGSVDRGCVCEREGSVDRDCVCEREGSVGRGYV